MATQTGEDRERPGGYIYEIEADESVCLAVTKAFLNIGIEPFEQDTQLYHWVDTESIETLFQERGKGAQVTVDIWGRSVTITQDEVWFQDSVMAVATAE